MMRRRFLGGVILAAACLGAGLSAAEAPGDPPPAPALAPTTMPAAAQQWTLTGGEKGTSQLTTVTRGGKTYDCLIANGGNKLAVTFGEGVAMLLECDLLLAEYDRTTRELGRVLCAGHVRVTSTFQQAHATTEAGMGSGSFQCAALEFERAAPLAAQPAGQPPADGQARPLGFALQGVYTLTAAVPDWPDLPAAFGQWLHALPPATEGRVLMCTDRLTLLAPRVVFDPVLGRCEAGPEAVTGALEATPADGANGDAGAKSATGTGGSEETGWSPLRRTRFSCRTLTAHFAFGPGGTLEPRDDLVMQGRVLIQQEPRAGVQPADGRADLSAETVTVHYPAPPAAPAPDPRRMPMKPPAVLTWADFATVTARSASTGGELIVHDGDLLLRGGTLVYTRTGDVGTLAPPAGVKFAVVEMNAAPSGRSPTVARARLSAQHFTFHLQTRDFEAGGERLLESLPPPVSRPAKSLAPAAPVERAAPGSSSSVGSAGGH